jgi:diaminohydroxyphosphoribosylaminopyrimidine deaminase / 5-amino-6-(5-phosphoribosylamino)uracil reductase
MATPNEVAAMRRAVALSAFGLGATSPNPPVGCVVLDAAGNVVGDGYHRCKGESHAEVNALAAAGEDARGGTAVVTLEPCNHQGRTPPCRQALIDAGIRRVVIALIDPTSREDGGAARLQAAGVQVELGVLADEARSVIGPWLNALKTRTPYVHWAYVAHSHSAALADPEPPPEQATFRAEADATVTPDGRLEEGVPGAHSPDEFSLPPAVGTEPASWLAELYDRGTRSLLLSGQSELASAALEAGLVERISMYVRRQPASSRPIAEVEHLARVPSGFAVAAVSIVDPYVRLDLVRG